MKSRNVLDFSSYNRLYEQQVGINDPKATGSEGVTGPTSASTGAATTGAATTGAAKKEDKEKSPGETSGAVKTISEIVSLFFKCYMFVATKTTNYPDVLADLLSVSEEKDPAKRAETMESVIKKVSEKVDEKYADIKGDAAKAAASIKDIYNEVASTEEAKKYNEVINKMVTSKIVSYQDILKNQPLKENHNTSGYKNILGFDNYYYPSIYEKNTFDEERDGLSDKMKTIYSEMIAQQKNPSSDALKSRAAEVIGKFDEYQKLLSDKGAWEKMKRKERKDKLESMNKEIDEVIQKTNDLQKSELIKIGVDKKIADNMSTIITSINSMSDKAKAIDDKAIADAKTGESQKSVEYKVGEVVKYKRENGEEAQSEIVKVEGDKVFFKDKEGKEFSKDKKDITGKVEGGKEEGKEEGKDIKSGTVEKSNIKKDGPNSEAIKKFQEDYNNLGIGVKLTTDGAYGRNTEKAIVKVANLIKSLSGKEVKVDGGKILSGELQGFLKKLIDNKDKIKGILG
jgi:hypothetical protein